MTHPVLAITAVIALTTAAGLATAAIAGAQPVAMGLLIAAGLAAAIAAGAGLGWAMIARKISSARNRNFAAVEYSLSQATERLEAMTAAVNGWLWETDDAGRFTYLSDNIQSLTGVPPEKIYGKTRKELVGGG